MNTLSITPKNLPHAVAAVAGLGGVVVSVSKIDGPNIWHVSDRLGRWENRQQLGEAVARACAKLGYVRDRRCKRTGGWRKAGK